MSFNRKVVIALSVVAIIVFVAVYLIFNPSTSSFFPKCVFLSATGYKCPGCGSQRAVHALLHGDLAAAFRYKALLLIAIPWIALCLFAESQRVRNPRLYARLNAPRLIWLFLVMVFLWWLLRNVFNW